MGSWSVFARPTSNLRCAPQRILRWLFCNYGRARRPSSKCAAPASRVLEAWLTPCRRKTLSSQTYHVIYRMSFVPSQCRDMACHVRRRVHRLACHVRRCWGQISCGRGTPRPYSDDGVYVVGHYYEQGNIDVVVMPMRGGQLLGQERANRREIHAVVGYLTEKMSHVFCAYSDKVACLIVFEPIGSRRLPYGVGVGHGCVFFFLRTRHAASLRAYDCC